LGPDKSPDQIEKITTINRAYASKSILFQKRRNKCQWIRKHTKHSKIVTTVLLGLAAAPAVLLAFAATEDSDK
jgi:hypothetical protein